MTDDTPPPAQGSPFWRFSLRFYRMPGVAEACIELQDRAGMDVNLLLFLLWNATESRRLSPAEVADLDRMVGEWRKAAVIPLREIRRALKSPPAVVERGTAEAFRTRIKQVELEAERLQQEATYALGQSLRFGAPAASPVEAARDNIAAYQANCPQAFPPAAIHTIMSAFAKMDSATLNKLRLGQGERR